MKKILYSAVTIFVFVACDTPNNVIGNPNSTTNTTGTTGSANMTNSTAPAVQHTPGTPSDSSAIKKDSLPR